jgi:hypothetical protein
MLGAGNHRDNEPIPTDPRIVDFVLLIRTVQIRNLGLRMNFEIRGSNFEPSKLSSERWQGGASPGKTCPAKCDKRSKGACSRDSQIVPDSVRVWSGEKRKEKVRESHKIRFVNCLLLAGINLLAASRGREGRPRFLSHDGTHISSSFCQTSAGVQVGPER